MSKKIKEWLLTSTSSSSEKILKNLHLSTRITKVNQRWEGNGSTSKSWKKQTRAIILAKVNVVEMSITKKVVILTLKKILLIHMTSTADQMSLFLRSQNKRRQPVKLAFKTKNLLTICNHLLAVSNFKFFNKSNTISQSLRTSLNQHKSFRKLNILRIQVSFVKQTERQFKWSQLKTWNTWWKLWKLKSCITKLKSQINKIMSLNWSQN